MVPRSGVAQVEGWKKASMETTESRDIIQAVFNRLRHLMQALPTGDTGRAASVIDELQTIYHDLVRRQQRRQNLLELLTDGFLVTDSWGMIRDVDPATGRLLAAEL